MCRSLLLLIIVVNIFSSANMDFNSNYGYSVMVERGILLYEIYNVSLSIYGNITNEGSEPLNINETDLLYFDYPINTSDQRVYDVKTWVDHTEYNYTIKRENDSLTLIINAPLMNSSLSPGETVEAGVTYYVSVNLSQRKTSISDFYLVDNPYRLIDRAGGWNELKSIGDLRLTNITRLWNYTHPLVKLVNKYIERVLRPSNPLAFLLSVLSWIDDNVVYSTRVPPRYPWEVIAEGAGDCDDQSNLLIAFLRSKGIPSYLEIGYVFIDQKYRYRDVEANGYIIIDFIGGGGHGWVSTYIPPWGWIRVDPIVSEGSGVSLTRVAIPYALYYIQPTIVTGKVVRGDYVAVSAHAVEEMKTHKIKYHIVIEMKLT
ncbi:MAG: transglutaminase [Desulfurococcales archaeon ex4484_58]|nr:MAG: transglutaminase [Desulfurococcales archaeon ex4484_58]